MEFTFYNMMELAKRKKEFTAKVETVDGVDVTIFSYMVMMSDTFDSELALEFRGTTFRNDSKTCICRPFKKFFNIGEREDTLFENINIKEFHTKFDGSMLTPVTINDKIFWKTKKSFYSDVAIKAQKEYENNRHSFFNLVQQCKHYTPIYEFISPYNRIVIEYNKTQFKYLGFRDIKTGEYQPHFSTKVAVSYDAISELEGIEGFVCLLDDGRLVKKKTNWYLERHKICSDFNPKAIINAVLDETIDDIIGTLAEMKVTERLKEVKQIRDEVGIAFVEMSGEVYDWWEDCRLYRDIRKDFAMHVTKNVPEEYRGIMFKILDDKPYDLKGLVYDKVYAKYKRNIVK